jgi:F0F1-type ATP synthase membrane subunit c/vacuolar-type H+-ATPase subunit K
MDKETGEFSSIVANIQKKMLIILIVQETIPVAIYALFIGMLAG